MVYFNTISKLKCFLIPLAVLATTIHMPAQRPVKVATRTEDPKALSDERLTLMDELGQSKKAIIILESEKLAELKAKDKEIKDKDAIIRKKEKQLQNERQLKDKYRSDVAKYKDSLSRQMYRVQLLDEQLEAEKAEKKQLVELAQQLAGENKTLEAKIASLEKEKSTLQNRVDSLERTLTEFDFFTSIRVQDFECLGYTNNTLNLFFTLVGNRQPDPNYQREAEAVVTVTKKYKMGYAGEMMQGCNSNALKVKMMTGKGQQVSFCSKDKVEPTSDKTDALVEYTVDVKVIYRLHVIWAAQYPIYDLTKCGKP